MKYIYVVLTFLGLFAGAGCESAPKTADTALEVGMSRAELRRFFGEPVRIVALDSGCEDWYYHFTKLNVEPTAEQGTTHDYRGNTSSATIGLTFSRDIVEFPVHVSPYGFVFGPIPKGKIVKE